MQNHDYPLDLSRDPLRVLESTLRVVREARHVAIDRDAVEATADLLVVQPDAQADWSAQLHPAGSNEAEQANLVLVLDALNFCFWNVPGAGRERWRVTYQGLTYDGYWALAVALRRAIEEGYWLADAEALVALTEDDVAQIFRGDSGTDDIPLLHARMLHLHEVGHGLLARWRGSFLQAIQAARGSAPRLVHEVLESFESFRDIAPWDGHTIHFYKRAQILVADVHGAFGGQGPGAFHDLHTLTAFADYKVPQVLRRFGVLTYAPELAARIARYDLIPPESDEEIEIRAATIWGVELLRQALAARGRDMPSYALDWSLWQAGQLLPAEAEPYHRTLTVGY